MYFVMPFSGIDDDMVEQGWHFANPFRETGMDDISPVPLAKPAGILCEDSGETGMTLYHVNKVDLHFLPTIFLVYLLN